MSRPVYSIRFPLVKERTGRRSGPRFRLVPDESGLWGARKCAAGMVRAAMGRRDSWRTDDQPLVARMHRAQMRQMALWARVFAGHIDQDDARIDEAGRVASACCAEYCQPEVKIAV